MSTSRRLAKNFAALSMAEVISRLLGALLSFYIARELGASVFGQFSFALAFTSFFNIFVDFGLSQLAVRDIAQDKTKTSRYGTNILALQLLISGVLTLLLVGILVILPLNYTTKLITFFFGLGVIPLALNMQYILQAHERMEFMAIGRVVGQIGYALLGFGVIYFTRDVIWLPLAQFTSALIWAAIVYYFIKRYIKFSWEAIKWSQITHLMRLSAPFLISAISIQIYYNIDSVILQFSKGDQAVGLYNSGYKIVLLILLLAGFITSAFFPLLSATWQSRQEVFQRTIHYAGRVMGLVAFPTSIGGIVLAEPLLLFLYKRPIYTEATISFQILLLLPLVIFISMILGHSLIAAGLQKQSTIGIVIGAIVNLLLNMVLIPSYGINGAAIATFAAEIAVLGYIYPVYRNLISEPVWVSYSVRPLLAALGMAVVLYVLPAQVPVLVQIMIGVITYSIAIVAIRGITIEDYRALREQQV